MKDPQRRNFLFYSSLYAASALSAALPAIARSYPAGPVRIVVPYPPGAATDSLARLMAQALEQSFGSPFIVDNKGGGATQIGTKAIAASAADGQTLGFIDSAFVINPGLFGAALPYDTRADFAPLSLMAAAPFVLLVHSSVPVSSLAELIALAKSRPGHLNFGSAGVGSAPHLAGEQLRIAAGIDINHVPYRGGSTVLNDLIAGHIQLGFTTVPTMIAHIRAGTVRALAVTNARTALLPDVPTMAEAGLPGVDASPIFGLIAPSRTPGEVLEALSASASSAVQGGALRTRLSELGFLPIGSTAAQFRTRIEQEIAKWSAVIKAGNIKPTA